ncbi:hypothetical protein ACFYYY_13145 [Streptomyces sp. NPDC001834]|uniref:hypothetical protein n=1 Tax=Streptomyces sp. NPDC001834 TaxID=3364616 RepID=UPI0036A13A6F
MRLLLLVATEGKPYILQVGVKNSEEPTKMTLSDCDKPVDVKASAPKGIVALNNPTG